MTCSNVFIESDVEMLLIKIYIELYKIVCDDMNTKNVSNYYHFHNFLESLFKVHNFSL